MRSQTQEFSTHVYSVHKKKENVRTFSKFHDLSYLVDELNMLQPN